MLERRDPPIMEPESFIQPGGLHGFAMTLICGLSCWAFRMSGIISTWSCAIEKCASVGSAWPLLSSKEYALRARSEAPIGLRRKLSPMPLPWRVNKLVMAWESWAGWATSFRRYIAESVVAAPNPSIG